VTGRTHTRPVAADSDQRRRRAQATGPDPAPDCRYAPLFGARRCGPSLFSVAYQLVFNGIELLAYARWDTATWADRTHRAALARAAALAGPTVEMTSS
jgi:hypothetical protein